MYLLVPLKREKHTTTAQNLELIVFDDSLEVVLSLWDASVESARSWKPSETILLLTNPGFRDDKREKIYIAQSTLVDVNPVMYDAKWLRDQAQNRAKRDHINPPFPSSGKILLIHRPFT